MAELVLVRSMRLVALIGNLLIAICLAGIAALFILGGSGTIADNLARLPAIVSDYPVLFVVGVANLLALVGIVAVLCGWVGGGWWGFCCFFVMTRYLHRPSSLRGSLS